MIIRDLTRGAKKLPVKILKNRRIEKKYEITTSRVNINCVLR